MAHDLVEAGHSESQAIQIAIGVIKNWAAGRPSGGEKHVDPTTVAAAQKALAQWEALKAKSHAKGALQHSDPAGIMDVRAIRDAALARVALLSEAFGGERGLVALLEAEGSYKLKCPKCGLVQSASNKTCSNCGHDLTAARKAKFANMQEAAGSSFSPELKRVPSARGEIERFELHHEGQHVGTISRRRAPDGRGDRYRAQAINGEAVGGEYDNPLKSKDEALRAVQTHLSEAPARVISLPAAGKYLVARPSTYGQTQYSEFPNEQAARHNAGLPPVPTLPERDSQVRALGEMLSLDLATLAGVDIPPLRRVQEACRRDPFV